MTITTSPARAEYTATAGQTVFNYTFKIFSDTDLNVYVTPSGQVANDATDITTSYTVTGVGAEAGGTIILSVGASNGDLVTIVSNIPSSRTTDYQTNGDFLPQTVNDDFDRVLSIVKKIEDTTNRSVVTAQSQQGPKPLSLDQPVAGKLLRWNGAEDGLENVSPSDVPLDTVLTQDLTITKATIAAAKADDGLQIGQTVLTQGYNSAGDGGNAEYIVAASQTVDGFGNHTKDNGDVLLLQVTGAANALQFGAQTGGFDNTTRFQSMIDNYPDIYIPAGVYHTGDLTVDDPRVIKGDRPKANTGLLGTVFYAIDGTSDKMITLGTEGITLHNLLFLNDFATVLTYMVGKAASPTTAFHMELHNITCKGNATTHFNLPFLWNSHLKMCRSEPGAAVGYNFDTGTSNVFDSCLAYSSTDVGFRMESMVYSVMNGCGVDACVNGIDFVSDNRGMTINSFGSEGVTGYTMRVAGTGNALSINSPYLDGTAALSDVIQVTSTSALTSVKINALVTTGVSTPASAKFISVSSENPFVSASDCYFSNTTRETDIDSGLVDIRGGNLDRSLKIDDRAIIASMATLAEVTILDITSYTNETVLVSADNSSGERFYDGKFYASFNGTHRVRTDNNSGIDLIISGTDLKLKNTLGTTLTSVRYIVQRLGGNIAS